MALLEEHGFPFEEELTNADMYAWCVAHRDDLPRSPVEIAGAFFPAAAEGGGS